jgi:Acetyltransferase (GNAT) domain
MTVMRNGARRGGTRQEQAHAWEMRWQGRPVRVSTMVPVGVWEKVAGADPSTMPFQTPAWRDCVCSGRWRDASRLYELADGRQLVLMAARRSLPGLPAVEASWPHGCGTGGVLAPGGVRPDEVDLVCADLARRRVLSATVRPAFGAAPAWSRARAGSAAIPRKVHVAYLETPFEDYWARAVPAKVRSNLRGARRHLERAGITFTAGNSPDLVRAFYDTYLAWIGRRARQRKVPRALAGWQARRAEPLAKFTAVAGRLGADCRIQVAWQDGRAVGAAISLHTASSAVGWRMYADRSLPARFRLTEVLIEESLRYACESGCEYLEMGESGGLDALASVKARFGGQVFPLAEYYHEWLPLSPALAAFQSARRRAEGFIVARASRR